MNFVEEVISEMSEWYLDDGNIADEAEVVLIDFQRLIVSLANLGLQINSSKCELVFIDNQEKHCREQILETFRLICLLIEKAEMEDLVIQGLPLGKPWKKLCQNRKKISNVYH